MIWIVIEENLLCQCHFKEKNLIIMETHKKKRLVILLVCPPGDLQIGLQALIKAHLEADVLAVGDVVSMLNVIERQNPDLVILDDDTQKKNSPQIIKEASTRWGNINFIVLVNDDESRGSFAGMGADLIITKGLPGLKLIDQVIRIVIEEKE